MEKEEFIKIDIQKFKKICNPFKQNIWVTLKFPITKKEITQAIKQKQFIALGLINKKLMNFWGGSSREEHIYRIAWFVENWDDKFPISIDFGMPWMGTGISIDDGNHRLAAAIYLKKHWIKSSFGGSIDEMKKFVI